MAQMSTGPAYANTEVSNNVAQPQAAQPAQASPTGAGGALTPQQLAAIQTAGQAAGNGAPGNQASTFFGDFDNSLQNSGLFDPSQLSAVDSSWNMGTGGTWNGAVPGSTEQAWDQQAQNAISGANANQSSIAGMAPNPNSPNAQATAAGYNPLQPAYLQQPATLNPTTVAPQYLSPQLTNSLGSQQTIAQLQAGVAPQNQQQDQQMMQMLATAGLSPSSTAGQTAFNNLAQQQNAGIAPSIASAIQNSQGNQLNAGEYNATTGNTGATYNANAANSAAGTNLNNQLTQQQYNANAYNNAGQQYFNAETGAYENNSNAFNAINSAGLSGANGLASGQQQAGTTLAAGSQNTFPTYGSQSNPYGALASAAGSYPSPTSNTTNNYATYGGNAGSDGYSGGTDASAGWGDYG